MVSAPSQAMQQKLLPELAWQATPKGQQPFQSNFVGPLQVRHTVELGAALPLALCGSSCI